MIDSRRGIGIDVSPPGRLTSTERYDDWPQFEAENSVVLEERDGKTTLTLTSVFNSLEMAQAWSGSAEGAGESFERLDELLKTLV